MLKRGETMAYKRLGDLLLSVGLISQGDLERALELQKTTKSVWARF